MLEALVAAALMLREVLRPLLLLAVVCFRVQLVAFLLLSRGLLAGLLQSVGQLLLFRRCGWLPLEYLVLI